MNRFIPIFLTLLYLVAMVRPVAPVIEFIIDQEYIAEFLCENTDKPELDCHGKCYLMQMLAEQEQKKQENLPSIDLSEYPIGFVDVFALPVRHASVSAPRIYPNHSNCYSYLYDYSDFHPPAHLS